LPPNGEESVTLTVDVPDDATSGRYDIVVTGTSRADASKTGSSVASVKVSSGSTSGSYGLDIQPRLVSRGMAPGGSASVSLTVSNTGTARDTLDLSKMGDASSWAVLQPISLDLTGGSTGTVDVSINVLAGTTAGRYVVTVRATSRGDSTKRTESNISIDVATPEEPPKIVSVNHEPLSPTSKDVITITAVVSGTSISYVEITYTEGTTTHPTQRMTSAGSSTYSYAIGPFKADTVIKYKVKVSTSSGKSATSGESSFVVKKAPVKDESTPGFELLGALAAVGVCAIVLGRRRN